MRRKAELIERLFLALGLLAAGGWMGWSLYSDHSRIESIERQRLATQATVIDENLGRQLIGVDNALTSVRSDLAYLATPADGKQRIMRRLQSLCSAMPGVRTILVLNKDGGVIASNRDNIIGMNFAWRDYFINARQGNDPSVVYVSPPFDTVPVGAFAINLVRVVTDAQGGFAGVVSATLDPIYFHTLLSSVIYAPDMWSSLTHADGKLFLVVPDQNLPLGADLARPGSLFSRHMESGQVATILTGKLLATGEERLVARRTVRPPALPMDKPLVVAVTRDLRAVFSEWQREATLQGGEFAFLVLMTGGGLAVFQKRKREYAHLAVLREHEHIRLQTILKTASDGIHIVDRDGLLLEANLAFLRMLGYDDGVIGKLRVPDWDAGDPWDLVKARIGELITRRATMVFETRHRRSDGVVLDVEINASGIEIEGKGYLYAASRDITERKQKELKLRESQHILSESQRIANIGSWHYELTGKLTWSDETYRIFRVVRGAFLPTAESLNALINPHDRQAMQAWIAACASGEKPDALVFRIVTPDGDERILSGCGELRHDDQGQPSHLLGIVHDITESKIQEAELRQSAERIRSMVEGTTDWVWETDINHCFSALSASNDGAFVNPPDTILGKRRREVASQRSDIGAAQWQAHLEDLTAHRSFRDFRYWITPAEGDDRWISASGTPRFDDEGGFLGYRGTSVDVSDDAAIALRLRMLSTVVEQSPVSVVITDPMGTVAYVNTHFTKVSGYDAAEIIGGNSRILASRETLAEVYREMWATITAGRRWAGELRNRRKDGTLHWEMMIIAPVLDDFGLIAHYVAVKEDVSERRALQDQLRQTNTELEQFASVASHDLRAPLRMVTSYLGLIEKRLGAQLNGEIGQFFGFAIGGARQMDRLITDLLEYSRTGKTKNHVAVSLSEAVATAQRNLSIAIREADAEVVVADGFPMVQGDLTELTRLFQNLIGNAVKYRAPERLPKVEVDCRRQGREWLISFRDNGMGIATDDQQRAFAIFQRLVPKDAYEGTGIGLAVCKKIVEHHGGRIWIESGVGVGSTFYVTLPATE